MHSLIQITKLNDFIFCPRSLYLHSIYDNFSQKVYHRTPQSVGKLKHDNIDKEQYSTAKRYLQGLEVASEKYGLVGKIDIYDTEKMELIERKNKVKQILQGSIDNLSMFEDNSFDAIVCLGGVLSHIVNRKQRIKAINESIRVAKKNAPIFIAVIGRLAVCMNSINYLWPEMLKAPDVYRRFTIRGDYFGGYGFAPCHFYSPEELKKEFENKTKVLEMVGLEGIFSTHQKRYNRIYKLKKYNKILWEMHLKTCTEPSIVGISEHFMIICRK